LKKGDIAIKQKVLIICFWQYTNSSVNTIIINKAFIGLSDIVDLSHILLLNK